MKKSITSGQKEQLVNFVKDVARKTAEEVLGEIDLDKNQFQRVIESGDKLTASIKKVLEQKLRELSDFTKFPITVDYGASVEGMVIRGKYDIVNDDITSKNFSTKRSGKADLTITLVHFNRSIGIDDVFTEIDKLGYRPAELHELLALGEKYPELQLKYPIIELGSVWQRLFGRRSFAYLRMGYSKRELGLENVDGDLHEQCRFAVVRK